MFKRVSAKAIADAVVSIILVSAAVLLIYRSYAPGTRGRPPDPVPPTVPFQLQHAVTRGQANAPVVMVVFADFECPFCRRFAREVLPELDKRYVAPGRLRVAFQHLPLSIHSNAVGAAVSAECARGQGYFWDMHDGLFAAPSVNSEQQRAVAETLGLDMIAFEECRLSGAAKAAVEQAADVSTAFAIQSTPTFYLGSPTGNGGVTVTQVIAGARPLSVFTEAIDSLVARAD